jgi:hypothetical protein
MNALDYFGKESGRDITDGAAGWILELEDQALANHFHDVDQFQIFLPAPGAVYQRTPVDALTVQYTDAFTPYGPLVGKTPAFRFFTLRPKTSNVYAFMPDEKDPKVTRGHRHFNVTPEPVSAASRPAAGTVVTDSLIKLHEDGLEVLMLTVGPETALVVEAPGVGKTGQFVYLSDGSASYDGAVYDAETLGWQLPEDGDARFTAGRDGCRIIVFRFPTPGTDTLYATTTTAGANA